MLCTYNVPHPRYYLPLHTTLSRNTTYFLLLSLSLFLYSYFQPLNCIFSSLYLFYVVNIV